VSRRAAHWLLIALAPALLACCERKAGESAVTTEHARFEFLTPSLVRMEYSPSGEFVDAPTAVVQHRSWPAVRVHVSGEGGWLTADSGAMTVRYRLRSGPFTASNLEVSWNGPPGGPGRWHPGDVDRLNLGGLTYSLDNLSEANLAQGNDLESPAHDVIPGIDVLLGKAQPGLLSRSGYALIDDSATPVWNSRRTWIEPRPHPGGQDWYLITYGRDDFRKVLGEYARLCGPIPMIPRYVLGPWITDLNFEYFPGSAQSREPQFEQYNQQHLEEEVARFRDNHIPLDTLVLDFAWHNYGWQGGYDWSPLVPRPAELLAWLKARGVKVSLNDHPGYANTDESILSFSDSHAPQVLKDLGRALPPKPSFDLDVSKGWSFATDPRDAGLREQWYLPGERAARWKPIRIGASWEAQGHEDYHGIAWYRTSFTLPAKLPPQSYLYLGQVRDSYRIFINGREATHSSAHWPRRLTYTDLAPHAAPGRRLEIVLRVQPGPEPSEEGNGILRGPVAIRDVVPPQRIYFDLANERQAQVSMRDLHKPLMDQGVRIWWVDGGSGAADMPGLNRQLWTNKVFYDYTQQLTGQRAFILARYGDWGSERYPGYFTGDTYSQWPVLAYEVAFTARGGNVLVPYISHDIGGFHGAKIDFDLYARWLEFGTFSPILRLHSAHENPREGNVRMPWVYGEQGMALARKYFTLRTQLIPYIYTYTWVAHRDSMPLLRPLYLEEPSLEEAYRHPHEYFFGDQLLVAPVLDPSGTVSVYLPPGEWLDFFSGKRQHGGTTFTAHYAVDETPVFVRDGAIIPEQPPSDYSDARPLDTLILEVYGSARGRFDLYEDDGVSLDYAHGQYAQTPITYDSSADGRHHLVIEPTRGSYRGQPQQRAYQLHIHTPSRPQSIEANGRAIAGWSWDAQHATAAATLPAQSIRDRVSVVW
jgi:alpha-glucosidase (family GH31 glycosyl hydrolase)